MIARIHYGLTLRFICAVQLTISDVWLLQKVFCPFALTVYDRWGIFKSVPKTSQTRETLQFLLDHPRRCFIYLFPSRQTWFLLTMLIFLK